MPSTYKTKDLEGAKFEAQVLQRLGELKEDLSTALKILERHDTQIQDLNTKDALRVQAITENNRRVDGFDARLRTVEALPLEVKHSVEQHKRDIDNAFLRLRSLEDKITPFDLGKWDKLVDDTIPTTRILKWAGAAVAVAVIGLGIKVVFGG